MIQATRYYLSLTLDGRQVMDGWWRREDTARNQFTRIVGKHGSDGARITLVDTETDEELAVWPEPEASPAT
ncbi:hypothetical protein ACFTY7_05455 [Streptomyces sp. NPDC057062]|uniref:hypothetical protein n=1 Tax=Streptomyces sp. NPDC057062 TaxID=3346011 RepID=UPI00363DF912